MINKTGTLALLLAPILGPIVIPFVTTFIILNELVRLLVSIIIKLNYKKYKNRVSLVSEGADGFWGYKKPGSCRNVLLYLMTPVGSLDPDKIADFYQKEIQSHRDKNGERTFKKFERILITACGYFCWKNVDNFNVRNHIRVLNKDKVYSAEGLQELLSQFCEDLDDSKPQWELVIIPQYDDGGDELKSILLARFLHGYMDGLSFIMLFKEHLTPNLEYTIDPLNFQIPLWKKLIFYINTFIYGPFFASIILLEKLILKPWILIPTPSSNDGKGIPSSTKRKKHFSWANSTTPTINDELIRRIRIQSGKGTTVTNVICSAIASAVTHVLPPNRIVPELLISELVAYLPYPNSNPQNRFAYFTYGIPTCKMSKRNKFDEDEKNENEPFDKIRKCRDDSLKSSFGPDVLTTFYMFRLTGRFPAFLSPLWLQGSSCSVLLSNAPFSKNKCTLRDGTQILEMAGFTPHPNDMGLSITTTRYGEEIKIFGCADSTWLSHKELSQIIDQIPIEINKFAQLCPPLLTVSKNIQFSNINNIKEGDEHNDDGNTTTASSTQPELHFSDIHLRSR